MSYIKAFISEYEDMGNTFAYKDYESIPKFMVEIIEDYCDGSLTEVPLPVINTFLNDMYEDMAEANEVTNIGVYDDE